GVAAPVNVEGVNGGSGAHTIGDVPSLAGAGKLVARVKGELADRGLIAVDTRRTRIIAVSAGRPDAAAAQADFEAGAFVGFVAIPGRHVTSTLNSMRIPVARRPTCWQLTKPISTLVYVAALLRSSMSVVARLVSRLPCWA